MSTKAALQPVLITLALLAVTLSASPHEWDTIVPESADSSSLFRSDSADSSGVQSISRKMPRAAYHVAVALQSKARAEEQSFAAKPEFSLQIKAPHKKSFVIEVTLTNNGESDKRIGLMDTPFNAAGVESDLFVFTCGGKNNTKDVEYSGLEIETFNAPFRQDQIGSIKAGESLTTKLDLLKYLHFHTAKACDLHISFVLSVAKSAVGTFNQDAAAQNMIISNKLTITPPTDPQGPFREELMIAKGFPMNNLEQTAQSADPAFDTGCTASQQVQIRDAAKVAKKMALNAINLIMRQEKLPDWQGWFGTSHPQWEASITLALVKVAAILHTGKWTATCNGQSCQANTYAYVFPNTISDHKTYLCSQFFTAPAGRARDSRPGTIIHELVHFTDIHSAKDVAYGTTAMEALALSDFAKARTNADSIEAYTEDQDLPFQNENGESLPTAPAAPAIPAPAPCADDTTCLKAEIGWASETCVTGMAFIVNAGRTCDTYANTFKKCCKVQCNLCNDPFTKTTTSIAPSTAPSKAPTSVAPTPAPTGVKLTIVQDIKLMGVDPSTIDRVKLKQMLAACILRACASIEMSCSFPTITLVSVNAITSSLLQVKSSSGADIKYSAAVSDPNSATKTSLASLSGAVSADVGGASSGLCSGQASCTGSSITSQAAVNVNNPPTLAPTTAYSSGSSTGCFSNENFVMAANKLQMSVGEVQVGTKLVTNLDNDEVWYVHRPFGEHKMLKVQLQDSSWIDLTAHHLVFAQRGTLSAGELTLGDKLLRHGVLTEVVGIETIYGQVSAPITMSGKIVVNGVEASCYAFGSHENIHWLLAPIRMLYTCSPRVAQGFGTIGLGMMDLLSLMLPIELYLSTMLTTSVVMTMLGPMLLIGVIASS